MNSFCRYTSTAPAAIAVVELSGEAASGWIANHWQPMSANRTLRINQIRYGSLSCAGLGQPSETETVVLCRTSVDRFEIHCHGGKAAAARIEHSLVNYGFQRSDPMGFQADRMLDRSQQEALEELQKSVSLATTSILMDQYHGALSSEVRRLIGLIDVTAATETIVRAIEELVAWGKLGEHLVHPWRVVLAGPPNVGKSSLLNAILGYQRAIVHATAGTTRDLLAEQTSIEGWPVSIVDSAGVRTTSDDIEQLGIDASFRAVRSADCLLLLVSPEDGWGSQHDEILRNAPNARLLIVCTKRDLGRASLPSRDATIVETDVNESETIRELLAKLGTCLVPTVPPPGTAVPFRMKHRTCLEQVRSLVHSHRFAEAKTLLESMI